MLLSDFIGSYDLISFSQVGPNGEEIRSLSESRGLLLYTAEGRMSVSLYRVIDDSTVGGAQSDIARNWVWHLFYAGTYDIRAEQYAIIHRVSIAFPTSYRDTEQVRYFSWDAEKTVLTLEGRNPEGRIIGRVIWKKIKTS